MKEAAENAVQPALRRCCDSRRLLWADAQLGPGLRAHWLRKKVKDAS
jgi:hypothetical protein